MTTLLVAAGSADPDPAHAPDYGWPIAVLFGLFALALVAGSLWVRFGSRDGVKWGSKDPEAEELSGADEPSSSAQPSAPSAPLPTELPGLGRARRSRLRSGRPWFGTYRPAVPPPTAGSYSTREEAERHAHQLDEQFADHLNQYEGYFEVVTDGDRFRVVEHRGRETPRAVPGSWSGGLGP